MRWSSNARHHLRVPEELECSRCVTPVGCCWWMFVWTVSRRLGPRQGWRAREMLSDSKMHGNGGGFTDSQISKARTLGISTVLLWIILYNLSARSFPFPGAAETTISNEKRGSADECFRVWTLFENKTPTSKKIAILKIFELAHGSCYCCPPCSTQASYN